MLHEKIKNSIKEAILMQNKVLLDTLRSMVASFTNELISKSKKPNEFLSDEEVIAVIIRLAKQRKDSIEQYKKGNRQDLVDEESAQLAILETYLPKLMEKSEIKKIVKDKKVELDINDATKKGMLMQSIMKDLKGKADGGIVKEIVDSLF
ncbi:glutamyl-tRNA amidotransferase [Candidatus Nomurabacteria bacterium CG_4_10_14_0_2_um_filter_30_12]|uniref:Glutamyl-tRNA amidotransferase n=2 Tax=Candidatus Nomuraibacteriota TaxID=1752729 RepID=A0A2J0MHJ7_9BACT|nr:MAG: glutamyl-tRNA amidotransferase [Candidatus Nomurabacteria bacterium CG10_big_fil_rev_8_21_14_0_10_03_31_7]PIZ87311.1 MAG: glutamyl-tRNA amidotransferase [Candidatus Nomurabacteria bacterium CG_4_10_14_0_2_um_filter_30_12]